MNEHVIHVGFTGTRAGMTDAQRARVHQLLHGLGSFCLHHGDCVGADAEAHAIARELGGFIIIHPPIDENLRAFCKDADQWRSPLTHLARNRAIVIETSCLIGTPREDQHQPRGGTWYTIDYAIKHGRPTMVPLPSGGLLHQPSDWPGIFRV